MHMQAMAKVMSECHLKYQMCFSALARHSPLLRKIDPRAFTQPFLPYLC